MKKEKKFQRHELLHKTKVHIKKKERIYKLFGLKKSEYCGFLEVKDYGFLGVKLYLF